MNEDPLILRRAHLLEQLAHSTLDVTSGAIHKGALKNHNISNNYCTNVNEVSFCC